MKRIRWCGGIGLTLIVGIFAANCSTPEEEYWGGACGELDEECFSGWNDIPGSICVNHKCTCVEGMELCCLGGWDEYGQPVCGLDDSYRCRPAADCHPETPTSCMAAADCP